MAKDKLTDYDSTASNNLDIGGISIAEGMLPSNVNNALREQMSHLADAFGAGTPLYVDQTNNRVGIGTTSPAVLAEITNASTNAEYFRLGGSTSPSARALRFSSFSVGGADDVGHSINAPSSSGAIGFETNSAERMRINSSGNVGIGTSSPVRTLSVGTTSQLAMRLDSSNTANFIEMADANGSIRFGTQSTGAMSFFTGGDASHVGESEAMRIDSSGNSYFLNVLRVVAAVGDNPTANSATSDEGIELNLDHIIAVRDGGVPLYINRIGTDGTLVQFYAQGTSEGSISVSGTTVSYNGGHLARWSQLADNTRDESILKGTVMTNLDQMAEWTNEGVTEDNEQLNCMAVSTVEGDPNVAGVFVNWDNDDDIYSNDMNIAMTGDMVIRIAQGTTVARGDLLMSAGNGTAKPQGDDIVRSKTIAKVTSTHVSHTYDDGSYLVPCVLMAC